MFITNQAGISRGKLKEEDFREKAGSPTIDIVISIWNQKAWKIISSVANTFRRPVAEFLCLISVYNDKVIYLQNIIHTRQEEINIMRRKTFLLLSCVMQKRMLKIDRGD